MTEIKFQVPVPALKFLNYKVYSLEKYGIEKDEKLNFVLLSSLIFGSLLTRRCNLEIVKYR
jgi:hypothetical protein